MAAEDDVGVPGTHLQLLGRFQVRRDGEEVPPAAFGGRKVRTLLRVLAVRHPDLVPHDALADAVWPDRLPADPAANLSVLVTRARRAVADPALVVTGTAGYALGDCTVDLAEFLAAVDRARTAGDDHAAALRAASVALALWGEPLPEDSYADWASQPRNRLLRARLDALEIAARAALGLGDARAAVAAATDVVAAEPLRESAVVVLCQAYTAAGDRAAALRALADLRARLADELGVDPSPEVQRLHLALLHGAPAGAPRVAAPVPMRAPEFDGLAFVGRDAELAGLRAALAAREVLVVAGAAGAGKSRLLAEAVRGCAVPVVAARAFPAERAEAWGLARSLLQEALAADAGVADRLPVLAREALAGVLPELGGGLAPALDGESRRALVLAGGLRVLEAVTGDGAVLVVDDLQWADPSSIALLGSALARLPRLAAVLAHRPEEMDPEALAGLAQARPFTELVLGPLPTLTGLVPDHDLAQALLAGTDGTPFAVAEVMRELVARRAVAAAPGGWTATGPGTVPLALELGRAGQRRAVRQRAQRQTGPRALLLGLVALLAREVPARTLAVAAGQEPRIVLGELSELARAGLLRLGEQGWSPAHDLVGETVIAGLDKGERGRLHGLLAAALEADGADPAEVARHHRGAGDSTAAAEAFALSARRALDGNATREAAVLAEAGLALHPRPAVRDRLLDARAEARAAHGDITGAIADLHGALGEPGPARSRRLARLATFTSGARDLHRAAELAELAVVEAGHDRAARAFALETAAILDMNLDRPDRASERSEEALDLHRALGDARGVARILDGRAMATFLDGRIADGVALFGRVAQLFEDSGDLLRVVTPRSTRGHGLVFLDRPGEGLEETSAALRLAGDLDAPEGQAYALWHRSEALSGLGRIEEAESDAREALRIAGVAGHRGWTATGYRALGIALQTGGDLDGAARAFASSAEIAGDGLTLFASWAVARSALVALARGAVAEAVPLVARALAIGPPLGHHEARLAEVELAAARGEERCGELAADALRLARSQGYAVAVPRLAELARLSGAAGMMLP
jgi:DNA-binding SARP family transcriptional activator/tetratricopeptide (TPR) repeat protein